MKECCQPCGGRTHNLLIFSLTCIQLSHRGLQVCMGDPVIYESKAAQMLTQVPWPDTYEILLKGHRKPDYYHHQQCH